MMRIRTCLTGKPTPAQFALFPSAQWLDNQGFLKYSRKERSGLGLIDWGMTAAGLFLPWAHPTGTDPCAPA